MNSLPKDQETQPGLPNILSSSHRCYRRHHDKQFSRSPAISFPFKKDAPRPQPPPRHIPFVESPAHPEKSKDELRDYSCSVSFVHRGYGNLWSSLADERPIFQGRDRESGVYGDEGYASYTSAERIVPAISHVHDLAGRDGFGGIFGANLNAGSLNYRPTEFLRHGNVLFQTAADLHGDSMKKKLDPIRRFHRSPQSAASSTFGDQTRRQPDPRAPGLSIPVQLPIHSSLLLEFPTRMPKTLIFSDASPRSPVRHVPGVQRMPMHCLDHVRSRRGSRQIDTDDASSTHGNYEFTAVEDMEIDDVAATKTLQPDGAHATIGQKRAAASPPAGDHLIHGGSTDPQRDLSSLDSSTPRLTVTLQGPSVSSRSSTAMSRFKSYTSTTSMGPSGITTATSFGRRSLGAASSCGVSPTSSNSPYTTPVALVLSSRASISGRGETHGGNISGTSSRMLAEVQKPKGSKVLRVYLCDCCPKKRKKFDTAEKLSAHEAEKQYECSFCGSRFKNKNDVKRHKNALHVRRQSWSCSALSGYDQAFHDSTNRPGETDICSYCGVEFPRSGRGPANESLAAVTVDIIPKHVTDQDWDDRIRHLQEVHKFRECNSAKKFYRADNFRQHLRHTHDGANGKWTNMLQNVCMMEEDPKPR